MSRYPQQNLKMPDRMGWIRWLPGLITLRKYRASWLMHDIAAGLVLATMLVRLVSRTLSHRAYQVSMVSTRLLFCYWLMHCSVPVASWFSDQTQR